MSPAAGDSGPVDRSSVHSRGGRRPRMNTIEPRFEFRVWGRRLDDVTARIRALSAPGDTRDSTETYIVASGVDDVNPKVRAGLLDIKVLVAQQRGFEQWAPRLKTGFPVDAGALRDEVFPHLRLPVPVLARAAYTLPEFLDEVVALHPGLIAVDVEKSRESHEVAGCMAEIARVVIAGRELQTAAIESPDLEAMSEALRLAGLDGHANVSYPRAIKQTLAGAHG